jgi:hypothetical protein
MISSLCSGRVMLYGKVYIDNDYDNNAFVGWIAQIPSRLDYTAIGGFSV